MEGLCNRCNLRVLHGEIAEFILVGHDFWLGQQRVNFLNALGDSLQLGKNIFVHGIIR